MMMFCFSPSDEGDRGTVCALPRVGAKLWQRQILPVALLRDGASTRRLPDAGLVYRHPVSLYLSLSVNVS